MSAIKTSLFSRLFFRMKIQEVVLLFITVVWGCTFLVVHYALQFTGPFFFVGVRFGMATLVLLLFSLPVLRGLTWYEVKAGCFVGIAIMLGYGLQTVGLQTISSSKSAFITAMYVPIVPLLQWIFLRRPPGIMSMIGVLLAFIGLVLLAGPDDSSLAFSTGEIITLFSALAIAAEIILISAYAGKVNVRRVTIIQLASASMLAFFMMIPTGESVPAFSGTLLIIVLGLGIATALIQVTMNWAQKSISPTRATLIYAGEPVWAGIVGRIAGEILPAIALFGGALIVMGVIVSELRLKRKKTTASSDGYAG